MTDFGWDLNFVERECGHNSNAALFFEIAKSVNQLQEEQIDINDIVYKLSDNNRASSFAMEYGVSLPNALISGLHQPLMMFFQMKQPLKDANSPDGIDVDLAFCILSPLEDGPFHLRRLSRISRLLGDQRFLSKLRQMNDEDSIRGLFLYPENNAVAA